MTLLDWRDAARQAVIYGNVLDNIEPSEQVITVRIRRSG
jgi:hypothetical protein